MALKGLPNVLDIRTVGLIGAHRARADRRMPPARAAIEALEHAFHDDGIMIRITGDTIALTPPLIISEDQIGEIVDKGRQFDQGGGLKPLPARGLRGCASGPVTPPARRRRGCGRRLWLGTAPHPPFAGDRRTRSSPLRGPRRRR